MNVESYHTGTVEDVSQEPPQDVMERELTPEELFVQFTNGNRDVFPMIEKKYGRLIGAVIIKHCPESDVSDVIQNVWLRVIKSAASFDPKFSLKNWLIRIAINCSQDHMRRIARHPALSLNYEFAEERSDLLEPTHSIRTNAPALPDDVLAQQDEVRKLWEEVEKLPDKERETIQAQLQGMSRENIAELLHLPIQTVASRIRRGRALLKGMFVIA